MREMIYQNFESLKPIQKLLIESEMALKDSEKECASDENIREIVESLKPSDSPQAKQAAGIGVAAVVYGFAARLVVPALAAAGLKGGAGIAAGLVVVGGSMLTGIALLAGGGVAIGYGAYKLLSRSDRKKLFEKKKELREELLKNQDYLTEAIVPTSSEGRERYLFKLLILIEGAILDITHDLELSDDIEDSTDYE